MSVKTDLKNAATDLRETAAALDADASRVPVLVENETLPTLTLGDGFAYEIANQVTRPVLQQQDNTPIFVKFDSRIIRSEMSDAEKAKEAAGKDFKKPPHVASVSNLETGELQTLVCNAILASEITEKYPEHSYVGLVFRIISQKINKPGDNLKTIRLYDIKELRRKA